MRSMHSNALNTLKLADCITKSHQQLISALVRDHLDIVIARRNRDNRTAFTRF